MTTPELRIGSLFAGYGGLDLGIEAVLDARTAWVSEIDPGACKVLASRFPDVPNLGDITSIDWATVPPVDIIAGGSPCQDLSTAGRRAGMTEGTRSNLWVAMREAVAYLKPTYVVWENVRGAYSAAADSDLGWTEGLLDQRSPDQFPKKEDRALRALGRVLGDLSDLGYDAEWRGLRASDVGACHQRFRIFVLAWRRDAADADHAGLQGHAGPARASQAERHGHAEPGAGRPDLALLPTPAASVANDGEGAETWLARRERVKLTAANGNGMGMPLTIAVQLLPTPRAAEAQGDELRELRYGGSSARPSHRPEPSEQRPREPDDALQLLPPEAALAGGPSEAAGLQSVGCGCPEWGHYAPAIHQHELAFGRIAPPPTEWTRSNNRTGEPKPRLSPRFVEWMMGLPAGWVTDIDGVSRASQLRMLGNGVVPQQAAVALTDMLPNITTREN